MGRLIPAGTGMKYYRNVKVAPDATENQKPQDEFDQMGDYIRGGLELPSLDADLDTDEGYDEAEETLDGTALENEEVFDDALEAEGITIEEDDDL